jgi:hypothetical protein
MRTLVFLMAWLGLAAGAWAGSLGSAVEVRIVSDTGGELPLYPVQGHQVSKAYAEATKGDQYSVVVRNRLNRRVGIVVAVDGRNIITGKQSWLKSDEGMYILEPYARGEFKGWRTGADRINRFYFTSAADSYAVAFNDASALGVIAVAVFHEVQREPPVEMYRDQDAPASAPSSRMNLMGRNSEKTMKKSAGTGYGREEYSPVREVAFDRESVAAEKIYLKYEWRETLCSKGILACESSHPGPRNRIWDDDRWAAPPPGRD